MKNINKIGFFAALLVGNVAVAQKGVELAVKHVSGNKYEVYAKANFTEKEFNLGPSQITVVLPNGVEDQKLNLVVAEGGAWGDNSIVYSPKINPTSDFHGISTLGAKVDLVEGNETLLFSFSFNKAVDSNGVRLFENEKDPSSSAPGMRGGDFSNTIYDGLAVENSLYLKNYTSQKITAPEVIKETADNSLLIYPNTTTANFNIALTGVENTDDVTVTITTELGKELMKVKGTKAELESHTFTVPDGIPSQNLIVRVKSDKLNSGKKLILHRN